MFTKKHLIETRNQDKHFGLNSQQVKLIYTFIIFIATGS